MKTSVDNDDDALNYKGKVLNKLEIGWKINFVGQDWVPPMPFMEPDHLSKRKQSSLPKYMALNLTGLWRDSDGMRSSPCLLWSLTSQHKHSFVQNPTPSRSMSTMLFKSWSPFPLVVVITPITRHSFNRGIVIWQSTSLIMIY